MDSITVVSATYEADQAINFKLTINNETIPYIFRVDAEYLSPLDPFLREWYLAHKADIAPWIDPGPDPVSPYSISKTTPWKRMTDDEADQVYAAMQVTSARLRGIYDAATYLHSGDDLWYIMVEILTNLFGEQRALELLARENT